ncbi:hypothetical protein JCM18903_1931 [Psychrobacter sp. JCM 18903]|uniref:hypothetical protein n=1 Tax=Psychrobacter sp. JCM 18903 TaxID=1298610 RepID=UPI0004357EEE|nr:hypothetical protein [Psychrobacter sp. JCM 18903]GAF61891.1 hypothetical protein JCM18903_1931 [Psychrobacter sp. JCM 18903]
MYYRNSSLRAITDRYSTGCPVLNVELDFSDRHIDLIEEGYELAVRIKSCKIPATKQNGWR